MKINIFNKQKKFEEEVLSGEYAVGDMEYSSYYKDSFKRLKKNKMSMFCLFVILLLILIAIFAPLLAPYDPTVQDYASILQGPSKQHLLGTDEYGRDILSRIIYGTRISLSVGILAQVIATIIGVTMGSLAAYYGGWVDTLISRIMEIFAAFPDLIFAMAIMYVLGAGMKNIFVALGLLTWVRTARMIRGSILQLKEKEYVEASAQLIAREREFLTEQLRLAGLENGVELIVYEGAANFLLFYGPELLWQYCLEEGVLLRDCSNFEGLGKGWFRTAVRGHEENGRLIEAVRKACERCRQKRR